MLVYVIVIFLIVLVLIVKFLINYEKLKYIINPKKNHSSTESNVVENFDNHQYQKFKETSVPVRKTEEKKEETIGNLDQCKIQCDTDKDCVGFVREKIADTATGKCYLISNVVNCHNEYREPGEKYLMGPGMSDQTYTPTSEFYEYDTYFKLDVNKVQKDSIQKCVKLNMTTGISPRKYPFSLLVMDENNNLLVMGKDKHVASKKEVEDENFYSKYSVFTIVKGLSGKGVSFKVNKNNSDFYVSKRGEGENLVLELEEDSLQFKQNCSFIMDLEYAEDESMEFSEVRYVSIKHEMKGIIFYWKINEVTQKVVLINKEKLDDNLEDIMFEFKYPLEFEPEEIAKPEETVSDYPSPSPNDSTKDESVSNMKTMSEELERLELDIRESQHQQNLKLMNIMLDVNKFKLQDLSMSNYLSQCVRTSEEPPSYIDSQINNSNSNSYPVNMKSRNSNARANNKQNNNQNQNNKQNNNQNNKQNNNQNQNQNHNNGEIIAKEINSVE